MVLFIAVSEVRWVSLTECRVFLAQVTTATWPRIVPWGTGRVYRALVTPLAAVAFKNNARSRINFLTLPGPQFKALNVKS